MNVSHDVVLNLIANTTTKADPKIQAELDRGEYPAVIKMIRRKKNGRILYHSTVGSLSTTAVYILFGRREPSASVVSLSGSVLMFSTPHGPVQHMFDSLAGVPQQMR